MKYDREVGVVRTSRRLSPLVVGVSDWMGCCKVSVRLEHWTFCLCSYRIVLATQNNDPLFDLLLGGIQTIKVRDDIFCLLAINPVVLLVVR